MCRILRRIKQLLQSDFRESKEEQLSNSQSGKPIGRERTLLAPRPVAFAEAAGETSRVFGLPEPTSGQPARHFRAFWDTQL